MVLLTGKYRANTSHNITYDYIDLIKMDRENINSNFGIFTEICSKFGPNFSLWEGPDKSQTMPK